MYFVSFYFLGCFLLCSRPDRSQKVQLTLRQRLLPAHPVFSLPASQILDEIAEQGIRIYQLPDADSDEDEEFKEQTRVLKASIPFAVIGSNQLIEVKGKKIRGRLYPWGVVEVENPEHNDFLKLRTMLVTHMQDLQEVTQDLHYENFRSERLKRTGRAADEDVVDKDQILLQKEAEVRTHARLLLSLHTETSNGWIAVDTEKRRGPDCFHKIR
ncbi:Septin-2 [Liparis tanakae]|uniref:Septin-2 n=1 Tax=Liparis tanakae TaxID=230148 RepID=A0A4Z2ECR1_9TELE|nr:Septin-2 [Liparis tanakae]